MKKILATSLIVFMGMSLFGCLTKPDDESTGTEETTQPTTLTTEQTEEDSAEANDETDQEDDDKDEDDETKDNKDQTSSGDITPVKSSMESPAKVGDWLETMRYAVADSSDHIVYYRITEIIRYNDEVQAKIDEYNDDNHLFRFDPLERDDLEYCLFKYEVYFPEDFPSNDIGILSADLSFSVRSSEGSNIRANGVSYIGISQTYNMGASPDAKELFAGDTFTGGEQLFVMVKDVDEYNIENKYTDDNGEEVVNYIKGE
ncbi:MAG: hypothetical protein GX988_03050 [Clostridiales bacterium]|nr:hypothetical protein [Clostridiales bacterium]